MAPSTTEHPPPDSSTWADIGSATHSRRSRVGRRVGFAFLLALVLIGLFGGLGPRDQTRTAAGAGYSLEVTYGSVVRSGQPAPLEISVQAPEPFDGPVELALDGAVFERLDFQNWYPNPDSETRLGETLTYEFAPPDGSRLDVRLDARTQPGLSMGPDDHWVALVVGGVEVARVDYSVWVAP